MVGTETAWQLFVYGTLRPGMRSVHLAHQAGLTVAHQATVSGVDLYHLEPEGYPAVVPGAGTVVGEVLSLSGSTEPLDRLEGMFLEPPLYRRERIVPDGWAVYVWIYLFARPERLLLPGASLIPAGNWKEFQRGLNNRK